MVLLRHPVQHALGLELLQALDNVAHTGPAGVWGGVREGARKVPALVTALVLELPQVLDNVAHTGPAGM